MSRSTKKPVDTDSSNRYVKRLASKTVRRYNGTIANGSGYKKLFCSHNICDWKNRLTIEEINMIVNNAINRKMANKELYVYYMK